MIYYKDFPEGFDRKKETEFAQDLLRYGLRNEYGIYTLPQICRTEMGKPYFPEYPSIHFNYSHSKSGCACVLAEEAVGVDLEDIRPCRDSLVRRICHPKELDWFMQQEDKDKAMIRIWTMKEAYTKYLGTGVREGLRKTDLSSFLYLNPKEQKKDVWIQVYELNGAYLSVCKKHKTHIQYIAL